MVFAAKPAVSVDVVQRILGQRGAIDQGLELLPALTAIELRGENHARHVAAITTHRRGDLHAAPDGSQLIPSELPGRRDDALNLAVTVEDAIQKRTLSLSHCCAQTFLFVFDAVAITAVLLVMFRP